MFPKFQIAIFTIFSIIIILNVFLLRECESQSVVGRLSWTQLTTTSTAVPSARTNAAVAYDRAGDVLLIFGGEDSTGLLDDTWIFYLSNNSWLQLNPTTKPQKRFDAIGVFYDHDRAFIITSGEGENDKFFGDIWYLQYLKSPLQWIQIDNASSTKPDGRYGAAGGLQTGTSRLWLSHGFSDERYSDTFTFDVAVTSGGQWHEVFHGTTSYSPRWPHPRCLVASCGYSDGIAMFGGCAHKGGAGGPCPALDTWKYEYGRNNGGDRWRRIDDLQLPATDAAMSLYWATNNTALADHAILYGGRQDTTEQKGGGSDIEPEYVHVLDIGDGTWTSYSTVNHPSQVLWKHRMTTTNNSILLFGGENDSGRSNAVWRLDGEFSDRDEEDGFTYFSILYMHGIFMYFAWGCCLQFGAFFARYFRHKPPNGFWFKIHHRCQRVGAVLFIIGFFIAVPASGGGVFGYAHGVIGFLIFLFLIALVLLGEFRPHHGDRFRPQFEIVHPWLARITLILALVNITLGVFLIISPVGVWGTWLCQFSIIIVAYIPMEFNKRGFINLPFMNTLSQDPNKPNPDDEKNKPVNAGNNDVEEQQNEDQELVAANANNNNNQNNQNNNQNNNNVAQDGDLLGNEQTDMGTGE